jgi:glycerate 2-kinase
VERGEAAGLDPEAMLEENDSYAFLKASGDLVMTGPTGTNVNDVMIVFNEGPVIDG